MFHFTCASKWEDKWKRGAGPSGGVDRQLEALRALVNCGQLNCTGCCHSPLWKTGSQAQPRPLAMMLFGKASITYGPGPLAISSLNISQT